MLRLRKITMVAGVALTLLVWQANAAIAAPASTTLQGDVVGPLATPQPKAPTAAAAVQGAGFTTLDPGNGYAYRDADQFVIRLVSNNQGDVETLRSAITRVAARVQSISDVILWVAPGTVPDTPGGRVSVAGEILLSFDNTTCGAGHAGCGMPTSVDYSARPGFATIQASRIWMTSAVQRFSAANQYSAAAHELGHALGLDHFDGYYNNEVQVMNSTAANYVTAGDYRAGDRNGLQFLHPMGRPWESLGGTLTSDPDVASWDPGRLDVVARGTNYAAWHKGYANGWYWWSDLGGMIAGGPTAVSWATGRIDVFARGLDNALWHRSWTGTTWSAWESLGGVLTSDPEVASWGPGRLDVFARGQNNSMLHKVYANNQWEGWSDLGGMFAGGAGAVSWGPGRIDVFGRGLDSAVWHNYWNGSAWSGWASLGGGITSDPDVASWAPGRLDVFARGASGNVWHRPYANGWYGWSNLGGQIVGGPTAVSWGPDRIDVVARGTNNALFHKYWDGSGW